MLHLIPAPLHRAALRVVHKLRTLWWEWSGKQLIGVRVIAIDDQGRILFVRHSYGSDNWLLPGGGIDRGETPLAAGIRELAEETGCRLDQAREIDCHDEPLAGTVNRVHLVAGYAVGTIRPDGREIVECRAFAPDALPGDMPATFARNLPGWITAAAAALPPR